MPYVSLIRPEIRDLSAHHRGVIKPSYIGSGEFKTLLQRTKISGEILVERGEQAYNAKWPERLLLGQHYSGQLKTEGTVTEHAYELRGRLFLQST